MPSVFSQILAGDLPGHFVWKDEQAFALMTIRPLRPGHVLIMPRQEIDHWDDLPAPLLAHLMQLSQRIAGAIKQAFPCARVAVAICGLEIPHAHIHLFPIDRIEDFNFGAGAAMATSEELAGAAARLRSLLSPFDPTAAPQPPL
ncbi:MAG TPA: HIT family protein [Spongiibacteraceae bacterium]|nr:HIT family protein [Spongiibacteraceae bacterium]